MPYDFPVIVASLKFAFFQLLTLGRWCKQHLTTIMTSGLKFAAERVAGWCWYMLVPATVLIIWWQNRKYLASTLTANALLTASVVLRGIQTERFARLRFDEYFASCNKAGWTDFSPCAHFLFQISLESRKHRGKSFSSAVKFSTRKGLTCSEYDSNSFCFLC